MKECSNCFVEFAYDYAQWWLLEGPEEEQLHRFCSPSCLTEFAWTLRESRPKLSKSKQEPEDA